MTQISISKTAFAKGISFAKKAHGRYQAGTQTWEIPDACTMLNAPRMYGWEIVLPMTVGQVCPRCHTYCQDDCRTR